MTTFWSFHLIVNKPLADDRRHVRDFIDADFVIGERYCYSIFEMDSIHKCQHISSLICLFGGNIKYFYRELFRLYIILLVGG